MDTRNYEVIDPDFSQPDYLPPCDGGACRPCPPMCPPPRPLPPCRPTKPGCTSNSTPWYGLPQWAAGDVTSWLMQMNGAMLRIDTIMHDLALRTGINGLPDDLVSCVAKVSQDVEVIKCTVGELSNKQANVDLLMQNLNTQFSAMKTDVASLTLSVTNLDTRIMTVDSKADGMKNDIVLLKTDLNMLSKTVQNLTANFTSFQNSVNQSIAELQVATTQNSNDINSLNSWRVQFDYHIGGDNETLTLDDLTLSNGVTFKANTKGNGAIFRLDTYADERVGMLLMRLPNSVDIVVDKDTFTGKTIHINFPVESKNLKAMNHVNSYFITTAVYLTSEGTPTPVEIAFHAIKSGNTYNAFEIQLRFAYEVPAEFTLGQANGWLFGSYVDPIT